MLQCLFDYGSLSTEVEQKYVNAIFSDLKKMQIKEEFQKMFIDIVVTAQNFIKEVVCENESSVSLRDIKRVKKLFIFYMYFIKYRNDYESLKKREINYFEQFIESYYINFSHFEEKDLFTSFIVSIGLSYFYRIILDGKLYENSQLI